MDEQYTVSINADTAPFVSALNNLESLSGRFGTQLSNAMKSAAVSGRSLDDVLRRLGLNLASIALDQGMKPLQNLASSAISGLLGSLGSIVPFAKGGVVNGPTLFPMGGRTGLMGEAGAEAILPLQRGADGRLGIAGAGGQAPVSVVFNVTTPDAPSFRRSEAQVTGMLARAVTRGMRTF